MLAPLATLGSGAPEAVADMEASLVGSKKDVGNDTDATLVVEGINFWKSNALKLSGDLGVERESRGTCKVL